MKKRTKALLFEAPAVLLLMIIPALGYLIIKLFNISPFSEQLSWGGLILMLVLVIAYFYGRMIEHNSIKHFF